MMPMTPKDADRIQLLMNEIQKEIDRLKSERVPPVNATDAVLAVLNRTPGRSRGEVCDLTGLTPVIVSRALQLLQTQGHVVCLGTRRAGRWYTTPSLDAHTRPKK